MSGSDDRFNPEEEAEKRREAAIDLVHGKGGVELLCVFPRFGELGFEELVEITPVSRATVSARLKEAERAGLIEIDYVSSDHGTAKIYKLSKAGKHLQQEAQTRSFERIYRKIKILEEELEEERDEIQSWVKEHLYSTPPPQDQDRDIYR